MEITKRELIASIILLAILFIIGLFLGELINNDHLDNVAKYNKALKIKDSEIFSYAMKTNVGNSFIEGDFIVQDPVTFDEIDGEYAYLVKDKEEYTRHTRQVTTTDSKGKTHTKTEVYYTWDNVSTERKKASTISLLGINFDIEKFNLPSKERITTIYKGTDTRFIYYGVPKEFHGTIFSYLSEDTIQGKSIDIYTSTIEDTLDMLTTNFWIYIFWAFWIFLSLSATYYFCIHDNDWLNS